MPATTEELAVDILSRAAEMAIDTPHAKGCEARDANGLMCNVDSPHAVEFSIVGLVFKAAVNIGFSLNADPVANGPLFSAAKKAVDAVERISLTRRGQSIRSLNDDSRITQDELLQLLEMARFVVAVEPDQELEPAFMTEDV